MDWPESGVSLPFIHPSSAQLIFLASRRRHPIMISSFLCSLVSALKTRRSLALENLALRQQLGGLLRFYHCEAA